MRTSYFLTGILTLVFGLSFGQGNFQEHFEEKTLRIDYLICGDANNQDIFLKELKEEPHWGGSKFNLLDKFGFGNFIFKLFDLETGELIYSKGFSSLFEEWRTTAEAKDLQRAFYQVNVMPFPKKPVRFVLEARGKGGIMNQIFEYEIDPSNYFINRERPKPIPATKLFGKGDPANNIDVAFIAEGYTVDEMDKFKADVKRVTSYIFDVAPFDKYQDRFNIYALESVSDDSGTDIPGEHVYRNTITNTSFYTFDVPRYLTTFDIKSLHDIAANVPYDHIFVLINTDRYGGGGFYNYYTCCSSDNALTYEVSTHEFGHGLVGLGDEYYESNVAYEGFYDLEVEPWEPNLTTLVDFDRKWKNMMSEKTPLPTPREKKFQDKIGVFEGGGYVTKGVYSPYQDCKMKSNKMKRFCPVCEGVVKQMILFYIGE